MLSYRQDGEKWRNLMPHKYYFLYWLPNQSKIYSEPYYFGTNDHEELIKNLNTAKEHGYEIEYLKDE